MARSVENVYADALLSVAKEAGKTEAVLRDAVSILASIWETSGFLTKLAEPDLGEKGREIALKELFQDAVEPETLLFLLVVSEKKRLPELPEILLRFQTAAERELGIGRVFVTSAFPVSPREKEAIEERIRKTAGFRTYSFEYEADESLIGGIVIRIGDRVVDGSVKHRLDELTRTLLKTRVE